MKVLFIVKAKSEYSGSYSTISGGLYNSARFVVDMINNSNTCRGLHNCAKLVEVIDNNTIDKEVSEYKPGIVIIEALWVVPEKFEILQKLYPGILWVIRLHSHIPFLANEGIAIEWLRKYTKYENVQIAVNYIPAKKALEDILNTDILYMPNYYPVFNLNLQELDKDKTYVDIACFGAIRPLKNQLIQAIAAIEYAKRNNLLLRFHINASRIENQGDAVLKNLRALFHNSNYELVEHTWYSHSEFLGTVRTMDLGMQVSLSETYNIITADFIIMKVPIVVSEEIEFVNKSAKASPKDLEDIVQKIGFALDYPRYNTKVNKLLLRINSNKSKHQWLKLLNQK
jgi:hypothetical protein